MSGEEKYIDYNLLSQEILLLSGDTLNFFNKYGDLYNFWTTVLFDYTNYNKVVSQQINFLKDLMNGFGVYKNIIKPKNESDYKAKDLYLKLLGNPSKNLDDILFNKSRNKRNKEIYLHAKILFDLREQIFKKLFNQGIIKSDDQSDIEYEKNIAEKTKWREQRLDKIKEKEQDISNVLFKHYFKYESPSGMYNTLSDTKKHKKT